MSTAVEIRPPARWLPPKPVDEARVSQLTEALGVSPVVSRLLAVRGYIDIDEAKRFLRPRLDQLHDPALLTGIDRAVTRLSRAMS